MSLEIIPNNYSSNVHPLTIARELWPRMKLYPKQEEIILSVWNNDETVVPAGNMLGKDFITGRIVPLFFLLHQPCRIVTTSAKDDHLRVLWGEIGNAISESVVPLDRKKGGPFIITHREIKRFYEGTISDICYVRGMVASADSLASLQGHHALHTLFVADECSSVPDEYFKMVRTWASGGPGRKRMLLLGNPWPCNNYFYRAVKGDPATKDPGGDLIAG